MTLAKMYGEIQTERSDIALSPRVIERRANAEASPRDYMAWFELGLAYAEQRLYREAVESMALCIGRNTLYGPAYRFKGEYEARLGSFEEAAADLELAVRLSLNDPEAWFHLGMAYLLSGDNERAFAAFNSAESSESPLKTAAWHCIALLKADKLQEAVQRGRKACEASETRDTKGTEGLYGSLCAVFADIVPVDDLLIDVKNASGHEKAVLGCGAAVKLASLKRPEAAEALIAELKPLTDDVWWGYPEHMVRL
jgi:tetratricopeptide (TPR) repeat protein